MTNRLELSASGNDDGAPRRWAATLVMTAALAVGFATAPASFAEGLDPAAEAPLARLEQAWNAGDGPAWGRQFWADADSVNIYGHVLHGGEAMGARHAVVFAGRLKGSTMKMEVLNRRALGDDVAVVDTIQEVVSPGTAASPGRDLRVHVAFVLQRRGGRWGIAHVQNTSIVAPPAE